MLKSRFIQLLEKNLHRKNLIITTVFVLILAVFILFGGHGLFTRISLYFENEELRNEILIEKSKSDSLLNEIKSLRNDSNEIERIAREKFGMVNKGEKTYYIKKNNPENK